jgi:hypothetical protein
MNDPIAYSYNLFGFDAVESLVKPTSIVALDARPQFDREMADKGRNFEFSDLTP